MKYTRRTFLGLTGAGLAGTLLPQARAESNEIITLDFRIQNLDFDLFTPKYFDITGKKRKKFLDNFIEPAQRVYSELGIELKIVNHEEYNGELTKRLGDIQIIYTTSEEGYKQMSKDPDLYFKLTERDYDPKIIEKLHPVTGEDSSFTDGINEELEKKFNNSFGIADPTNKIVYLLSSENLCINWILHHREYFEETWQKYMSITLAHEIGHIYKLPHSNRHRLSKGKTNIMNKKDSFEDIEEIITGRPAFSKKDAKALKRGITELKGEILL